MSDSSHSAGPGTSGGFVYPLACAAESFLFFAGSSSPGETAARAARGLLAVLPRSSEGLSKRVWPLDELNGGLVWVHPNAADRDPLLSVHDSPTGFIAVYGKLHSGSCPAEAVAGCIEIQNDRWVPIAKAFDGSFTVIAVDRAERTATIFTDQIGCRALSWCDRGGALSVSPHSIALVGAGAVPVLWDLPGVASSACVDWSVGRRSFLKDVRTLRPYETLRWRQNRASIERAPAISFDSRVDDSRQAMARLNDAIVDTMVDSTRRFAAGKTHIDLLLTAGLDSRAMLGLLSAAGAKPLVRASTSGETGSTDVVGASRLAAACGIPHERNEQLDTPNDDFDAHVRLYAFLSNGDSTAKHCLARLPRSAHPNMVGGCGGEIFTGFYYPVFLPFGSVPDDPAAVASIFMTRLRKGRWSALGAWGSDLQREARDRLVRELESYRELGARRENLADLLYLWERYGHWGSLGHRLPWVNGWTPFLTARAVRGLFRFPRAAGKHCDVHARIIRRYLPPSAYLMPINGSALLPLRGTGELGFMARQAQQACLMLKKAAARRLPRRAAEGAVDQMRARGFRGRNYDTIHSLLTDSRSLSTEAFGANAIGRLLDDLRGSQRQIEPIGFLVMAESFRILVEEAAGVARKG